MTIFTHKRLRPSVAAAVLFLSAGMGCGGDDPVSSGDDGGDVEPPRDTTAPQTIDDLALAWRPGPKDVEFTWSAPRDDADTDHVARYDIRYAYSFPLDWDLSVPLTGAPDPLPEGSAQASALPSPLRGRDLYAAARTFDAAGNPSPVGPVTHMRVPGIRVELQCEDVFSGGPLEGLDGLLTTNASWSLTSGADGRFILDDVNNGTLGIRVRTGSSPTPYHPFERSLLVEDDLTLTIPMIPVIATDSPLYQNTLQIVVDALVNGGAGRVLKRWDTYPVPWYAPSFANGNGLDYTALSRQAAAQWNLRTGIELFVEVGAPPANGIEFQYLPRSVMGATNGVTSHRNDAAGYPAGETIKIVDDFSDGPKLYTILMHELGHTIRLAHLPAGFIMFAGQPLPSDITDDEVRTVQMMLAIPNGTDLARYDASATPP